MFGRHVYGRSRAEPSRGRWHRARGIHWWSTLRAGVLVEHQVSEHRTQGDCGETYTRSQGAGGNGVHDGKREPGTPVLQPQVYSLSQTGGGLDASQPAQCVVDFRLYVHCKVPSCSILAASACRARYSRERIVDSVVFRTRAISTVDSSFTAESSKTSRSLSGRVSMRPRIRAWRCAVMTIFSALSSPVGRTRARSSKSSTCGRVLARRLRSSTRFHVMRTSQTR